MKWSSEEVERLKTGYRNGEPVSEIAEDLSRSKNAIRRKATRLDLEHANPDPKRVPERVSQAESPTFDDDFAHFVCGFVAGEGCFSYRNRSDGSGRRFRFQVSVAEVDEAIIEELETFFGVGAIYSYEDPRNEEWEKEVMFTVQSSVEMLTVIVPFFEQYPLRGTNKQRQYEEWKSELLDEYGYESVPLV